MKRAFIGLLIGLLVGAIAPVGAQKYGVISNLIGYVDSSNALLVTISGGPIPGATDITFDNGGTLRTSTTSGETFSLQAYDVDGAAYTNCLTLTAANTPTIEMGCAVFDVNTDAGVIDFGASSDNRIGRAAATSLYISKGLHVGGTSDAGDNNLLVDGSLTVSGQSSYFGGASKGLVYTNSDTLNFAYSTNGTATGYINYFGYNDANTQFRNLIIADGKAAAIATFTGSDKSTTLAGTLTVQGATITAPAYVVGATAGADCTSAGAVTTSKGIVTACSQPVATPDELLAMIQQLQEEIAALKAGVR